MREHRVPILLLGAVLVLAGGLRLGGLDRMGLGIDEAFSLSLASYGPRDILIGTAADQHPPLFYLLLHGWMQLAGRSVFAIRLLSALIGWVTIALIYRIGRHFGTEVGLLAAGLLAISPAHIWYSQETRMYALLVLLGTLSTWLAWRWWADDTARTWPRSLLYVAVTLAALYTHYFTLFLIAAQNIAGLLLGWLQANEGRWPLAGRWLAIQTVVLIGFLPWLPTMIDQTLHHRLDWIPHASWPLVRQSWLYLLYGAGWQGSLLDCVGAILGLGLMALAVWPHQRSATHSKTDLYWVLLWFWVPVLLIILVALYSPIYQDKQLLIVIPPLVVLLATGLLRFRHWIWRGILIAAILALTIVPLLQQYANPNRRSWDELAAYLNDHAQPGDLLYINAAAGGLALDYYLAIELPQAGYPTDYDLLRGGWAGELATAEVVDAQLSPLAEQHSRIWLVEFSPGFWDPGGLILGWLQNHYREVKIPEFDNPGLRLFFRETSQ